MAYTLVSGINITGQAASTWSSSSTPVDTTGVDLITIAVSNYGGGAQFCPPDTDSKGNVYTLAKSKLSTPSSFARASIYYLRNPTVGTGHYWSITQTNHYFSVAVRGWIGSVASPLDANSSDGTAGLGGNCSLSTFTPTEDHCLVLAAWSITDGSNNYQVDAPLVELNELDMIASTAEGLELAYILDHTPLTALTPRCVWAGSAPETAGVAVAFHAVAGGATDADVSAFPFRNRAQAARLRR